jgi:hypothetical protein
MKLLSKVLALVLAYFALLIIVDSCRPCKNNKYDIDRISLKNLVYSIKQDTLTVKETDTTVLKYSQFGIRIKFHDLIYSYLNCGLTNTAMAIECFPAYILQHNIESISVITLGNFDQNHIANTDISEYFKASYFPNQYHSIDSTLDFKNGIKYYLFDEFDMLLNKAPQLDSVFRFVIKVKFDNNELTDTTELIKVLK